MTDGNFPARFVIDDYFIRDILKNRELAVTIIRKLNHIHTKSTHHPFRHNIIFDESFKKSIDDKQIRGQAILGIAHPISIPDFLKDETNFYSKVIRYSISIADKLPRKIIILTSPDKQKEYENNPHYRDNDVKRAIKIVSSSLAIEFIDLVSNIW